MIGVQTGWWEPRESILGVQMNIALIIEKMHASRGGREASTAQIAEGLALRGHGVSILCQQGELDIPGVEVRALGKRGLGRSGRLRNFVSDVHAALESGDFDVSHAMLPIPAADVYQPRGGTVPAQVDTSRRRRSLLARPLVDVGQYLNLHRQAMARLESVVTQDRGTWCLANSEMVAREFEQYYGRVENVRVVYNGVDLPDLSDEQMTEWRQEKRYRFGAGGDDLVFLTVATNLPLKGVDRAIRAFARWVHRRKDDRPAHLLVAGCDEVEGYRRRAGLNGVGRMTHFVGKTDNIFPWYAAADACILLSWYDACSRVILEAVRLGLPSLTTTLNGAAEVLSDGAGIVVATPDDFRGIVAGLDELADDRERARRAKACQAIAETVSMARHVDELVDVYKEIKGQATT
jgi:glycosyltransferase involved in cell wall biosynthesis